MAASTSDSSNARNEVLLDNHLAFTALHRGRVQRSESAIQIQSSLPGFTCLLPLADERNSELQELLAAHSLVRLVPWRPLTATAVERHGYHRQGGLSYMVLRDLPQANPTSAIAVEQATTLTALRTFTEVQVAGFGSTGAELDRWVEWLSEVNLRQLNHPQQTFLIARLEGRPVGVTLLVYTDGTAGIYAVATLPAFRKRGVSTALLHHAVAAAKQRGCATIGLQVLQDSYAQSLYRSLGFSAAFEAPVFVRKASTP